MGEIADAIIDGEFDYLTGEYLGKPTGYPRSKHDYFRLEKKVPKTYNPRYGISNYLKSQKLLYGAKDRLTTDQVINKFILSVFDILLPTWKEREEYIQHHFGDFVKWVKKNNKIIYIK